MALLVLSELLSEVTDIRSDFPQAKLVRALNQILSRIHFECSLPQYSTFTTKAATTTGTVEATNDSTTVTFSSSVLATTDPIRLVQIENEAAWFTLARTSGTGGTLSSKWAQTTDSAATYTIAYPAVTFPYAVGQILRIWREGDRELKFAPDRGSDWPAWPLNVTGTAQRWMPYIHDSTAANPNDDLLRILLDPAPEDAETWMYAFMTRPTLLSPGGASSQTIPLPDYWNRALIAGCRAAAYEVRDGLDKAQQKWGEFERIYRQTKGASQPAASVSPRSRTTRLTVFSPNPTNA